MTKINKVYIYGALLGVLAIGFTVATTFILGRTIYIGTSTTMVRAGGFIERFLLPESLFYSANYDVIGLRVDWQFMLVVGIALGSFISAISNGTFKIEFNPPIWKERFGDSKTKRAIFAFIGGMISIYGARIADGCPSGHGISGLMQLSVSGFVAMFLFFAFGILTARIMYRQ